MRRSSRSRRAPPRPAPPPPAAGEDTKTPRPAPPPRPDILAYYERCCLQCHPHQPEKERRTSAQPVCGGDCHKDEKQNWCERGPQEAVSRWHFYIAVSPDGSHSTGSTRRHGPFNSFLFNHLHLCTFLLTGLSLDDDFLFLPCFSCIIVECVYVVLVMTFRLGFACLWCACNFMWGLGILCNLFLSNLTKLDTFLNI